MKRITEQYPRLSTFNVCQICGYTSTDICEFRMWFECDENGRPEEGNFVITCSNEKHPCAKVIDDHPRGYHPVGGGFRAGLLNKVPGTFISLCGDCCYRNDNKCTNPNQISLGGGGLEVKFGTPMNGVRVCFSNGTSWSPIPAACRCAGYLC